MKVKELFIVIICLFAITLTGCRNYTVIGRNTEKNNSSNEQAIQEEQDAIKSATILSNNGMKLWKEIKKLDGYEYSYDKKNDTVTINSDYFEIVSGGKQVNTVYFTIYKSHPLEDKKTMEELCEVIKIMSKEFNIEYNEEAIIESLSNVDYSKALNSFKNNYSDSVELFSILWNDGTKDCIDFRIQPKKS